MIESLFVYEFDVETMISLNEIWLFETREFSKWIRFVLPIEQSVKLVFQNQIDSIGMSEKIDMQYAPYEGGVLDRILELMSVKEKILALLVIQIGVQVGLGSRKA